MICRTIYRVVEFVGGWNGKVNTTQAYFREWPFSTSSLGILTRYLTAVVFDGIMITLAMLTLNVFHPGVFLRESNYALPASSEDPSLTNHPKTGNFEMRTVPV